MLAVTDGSNADIGGIAVRVHGRRRACVADSEELGERFHIEFGRRLVAGDPGASYCGLFRDGGLARVVAYAGPDSGADAAAVARSAAAVLGGSGGGKQSFAQGGGQDASRMKEAAAAAMEALTK